ncbi:MAG: hypothetical protein JSS79_08135 [Bacteroidetes bacterium]|nr:hypothetical protein [Bacteroidota bacterium]
MEAPKVQERKSFWQANKETIVSIIIILMIMFFLKYLFQLAWHAHLV